MNKYERYALRQMALNMIYPPAEENKIFGNRYAWELLNAMIFFKMGETGSKTVTKVNKDNEQPKKQKPELTEEQKQKCERKLQEIIDFTNKPTHNPFIMFAQWFVKYITGCIVSFAKATGRLE